MKRARLALALAVGLFATGLTSFARPVLSTAGNAPEALPYYDTRDFTPRWSPVAHRVDSYRLLDQSRQVRTERDLDGKIHVASFLFVECPSVCPILVERLKPVQQALRGHDDVVMVSYSVTPAVDTPEVLAEFGRRRGIDAMRWRLLTGEVSEISRVIRDSYFADDDRPIDDIQARVVVRLAVQVDHTALRVAPEWAAA